MQRQSLSLVAKERIKWGHVNNRLISVHSGHSITHYYYYTWRSLNLSGVSCTVTYLMVQKVFILYNLMVRTKGTKRWLKLSEKLSHHHETHQYHSTLTPNTNKSNIPPKTVETLSSKLINIYDKRLLGSFPELCPPRAICTYRNCALKVSPSPIIFWVEKWPIGDSVSGGTYETRSCIWQTFYYSWNILKK